MHSVVGFTAVLPYFCADVRPPPLVGRVVAAAAAYSVTVFAIAVPDDTTVVTATARAITATTHTVYGNRI